MLMVSGQSKVDYEVLSLRLEKGGVDPFEWLGVHPDPACEVASIVRLWRPGAAEVYIEIDGCALLVPRVHPSGLFEWRSDLPMDGDDYRIWHSSTLCGRDPYTFWPYVGEFDRYLFNKGVHYQIYNVLGAHSVEHEGVSGVCFALWAPSARRVALVGDFNHWDGRINPMRLLGSSGIWELFVPGLKTGEKYKFEVSDSSGNVTLKADPYAFSSELRPQTASVVADVRGFPWRDQQWIERRKNNRHRATPLVIYEVHLGSWKRRQGAFLNYREIAIELAAYCLEMAFTHVELMPIQEHPLDESWGYQVSGYYGVTSRYGTPQDFQWFVDYLHSNGIGVILDWVPAHFPTDSFSLSRFDGTALYEHEDPRQGFHPHWQTNIFNFGRHEVSNFLISNALYWFEVMHIDGLRVDAVASLLYLDYGREDGEWVPNVYGGKENLEAIEFIKHLNAVVHSHFPGALMIAEESTSFQGVSHDLSHGGLGFDIKWNMGWMNDTLRYFSKDMIFRHYHHNDLTFGLLYAFSERFMLVLSHDEVVHGKRSLIDKMPGDLWQRFANLRLLYSYMMCQPGKKLLFMGGEIAQWNEWSCSRELEWDLLKFPYHSGVQRLVSDINHLYQTSSPLWERDHDPAGFEWVDFSDRSNSVISYLRKSHQGSFLCVHNFTPTCCPNYQLPLHCASSLQELFNSDHQRYGGAGNLNAHPQIRDNCVEIVLAPLATMIFSVQFR